MTQYIRELYQVLNARAKQREWGAYGDLAKDVYVRETFRRDLCGTSSSCSESVSCATGDSYKKRKDLLGLA